MTRANGEKYSKIKDIDGYGFVGQEILPSDFKWLLSQFGIHAIHKDGKSAIP